MKPFLTVILILGLIVGVTSNAAAEILFGVSGEVGKADVDVDYRSLPNDFSDSPNQWALTGNLNLLGTHVDLTLGKADMGERQLSSVDVRVGWELGLDLLKVRAFGGGQHYRFTDDTLPSDLRKNTFTSLVVGAGIQSEIKDVTVYGTIIVPLKTRFENDALKDNDADLSYVEVGVEYAPMPFVDVFLKYRTFSAESDFLTLDSDSYTLGLKVSF